MTVYYAQHKETGRRCGHEHHSIRSAKNCGSATWYDWEFVVIRSKKTSRR